MKKIIYIIPGYAESHKRQKAYHKVANLFLADGFTVEQININWHKRKPRQFSHYVEQFLRQYKRPRNAKIYILGFSYGAVTAFLSEPKTQPTALILCSLSPYFEEDIEKLSGKWLRWWRREFKNSDYPFNQLGHKIKSKTFLICGDKELSRLVRRVRIARRMIPKSSLFIAKNAHHNMAQKGYLHAIQEVINRLPV